MATPHIPAPLTDGAEPEPGWWALVTLRLRQFWERALDWPILWWAVFLLVGALCLAPGGGLFSPRVTAGAIAGRDYVAVRDLLVPDQEATEERRQRARESILPVYDFDSGLRRERLQQLGRLFATGRHRLADDRSPAPDDSSDPPTAAEELSAASGLRLSPPIVDLLIDDEFSPALEENLTGLFQDLLEAGVIADKTELLEQRARGITRRDLTDRLEEIQLDIFNYQAYPDEMREAAERDIRSWRLVAARSRPLVVDFVVENITPNLLPNRSETMARRDEAERSTGTVLFEVRKGQIIVRQGDRITPTAAETIALMVGENHERTPWLTWAGVVLLLILVAVVLWLGLKGEAIPGKSRVRVFHEVLLLLLASVVGVRFGFLVAVALADAFDMPPLNSVQGYLFAIPFAALAMTAELLWGRVVALQLSLVFAMLVGKIAGAGAATMAVYCVAGSLAGMYALGHTRFRQRSALTRAGLKVGLINGLVIVMMLAAADGQQTVERLAFQLLCGVVGGLLSAAAVSFVLPILESLFSITTDIKLIELANTNVPLLQRVALEAPGTFQHSLMVANLAKTGCEAIGADSVLAYTSGLYHDIGKVCRSEYFIENQRPGANPHDLLKPEASAAILIEHITMGLELGRRHHLPKPLVDAIAQHHGTRLMTYFHSRALAAAGTTLSVHEAMYRYPGPTPQSRVMGVLMLADAVEAASRTLVDGDPDRVRSMVRKIFDACAREQQLDDTDLTLGDIRVLSEAFVRLLTNHYHQRVDYPGYDFNRNEEAPARSDDLLMDAGFPGEIPS